MFFQNCRTKSRTKVVSDSVLLIGTFFMVFRVLGVKKYTGLIVLVAHASSKCWICMAVDSGWLLCRWTLHLQMSWPDDAVPLRFAYVSSIRWQEYLKKVLASRYLRSPFEEQRPLFSRVSLSKTLALSSWFVGIASVVRQHTHVRPPRRKTNQSQCDAEEFDIYLQQQEEGPLVLSSRCNSGWHSPPKSDAFSTLADKQDIKWDKQD